MDWLNDRALLARLDDLMERTERGEVTYTAFLTPGEAARGTRYATECGYGRRVVAHGGYPEAERVRLFFLPEYYEGMTEEAEWPDALCEAAAEAVVAVAVKGSGYRKLGHRDFMGSILGLGIDRDALGDILVMNDAEAVVFCGEPMVKFLLESLEKVASDTVKVSRMEAGQTVSAPRRFESVSDTVASPRLDCVVAALANVSREKAQAAVREGLCEVDYVPVEACDLQLDPPCILSVRGVGKFRLLSLSGPTKKGRLRLTAEKYK